MDTQEKILRLVNEANPDLYRELTFNNVTMGLPGAVTQADVPDVVLDFRNTRVQLGGIPNRGYKGVKDVYYGRHDLSTLFTGHDPELRTTALSPTDLLDRLNAKYGLYLTPLDLNDVQWPTWEPEELEVTRTTELRVVDTSYGWIGTVTVAITYGNPLLEDVVVVQLLPILQHPNSLEELDLRRSGTLSTWGFDFTPYKHELQRDDRGRWANFGRVQEIGQLAGLTYWYNSTVADLPTSSVPGANPLFQRVMVQNYTRGNVLGPVYFHYDNDW